MRYLPSKKFIVIACLIILGGGGFFLFSSLGNKKNDSLANVLQNSFFENIGKMAEEKDSDADGLKDWEEVLWGTDINNSDTDKDGYSDKQEADAGYDALDPLSNEKTGKKGEPREFVIPDVSGSINLTLELAKTAGSQVFMAGTEGTQLDLSSSLNFLDEDVNKELAQYIAGFNPIISEKELKISSDNSPAAIEKYFKETVSAFPALPYPNETDLDIIEEAMQTKNFEKIDKLINFFSQAVVNFKKIIVPSDFLQFHKQKIELLMASQRIYESVKEIDKDPLKAILGIQQMEKLGAETQESSVNFLNFIEGYFK